MSLSMLFNKSATLLRHVAGAEDGYGHPADSWVEAGEVVGRLQGRSGQELPRGDGGGSSDAKAIVVETLRWYMGAGQVWPEIAEEDRLEIRGGDGEFGALPQRLTQENDIYSVVRVNPVGGMRGVHHLEVDLRRIK